MPDVLTKIVFAADMILNVEEIRDFSCGDEEWAVPLTKWIKGDPPKDSVISSMAVRGTRVWLYANQARKIIGFGSLGTSTWKHPGPRDKYPLSVIPMLAVDTKYQGQPRGPGELSYARQIIRDLRREAEPTKATHPKLGLYVHPHNTKAIRLYSTEGFHKIDHFNGNDRMVLEL